MKSPTFYWDQFRFRLKRHFVEVLKSSNSDRSIAWGYALGTFVAILPTPGISILIGFALIAVFKNINKLAIFLAMAVWNAFTVLPIYWLSLEIGQLLFKGEPSVHFEFELLNQIYSYTRRFIVGNLFVSIPISVLSYYLALFAVGKARAIREKRGKKNSSQVNP